MIFLLGKFPCTIYLTISLSFSIPVYFRLSVSLRMIGSSVLQIRLRLNWQVSYSFISGQHIESNHWPTGWKRNLFSSLPDFTRFPCTLFYPGFSNNAVQKGRKVFRISVILYTKPILLYAWWLHTAKKKRSYTHRFIWNTRVSVGEKL